nr:MAG TPA: hypothetical protein [Caudoviricetes sp.]
MLSDCFSDIVYELLPLYTYRHIGYQGRIVATNSAMKKLTLIFLSIKKKRTRKHV